MNITYFHRNKKLGFSIDRVYSSITKEIRKDNDVSEYYIPTIRSLPFDIYKNCWYTFKHRNKEGINHISGHIHDAIFGLIGCKRVLTIHDLVFLENVRNPIKKLYKWLFWFYLPIKVSDKIVCISEQTKNKILERIKTNKLIVIENPIDPNFKYSPKLFDEENPIILHIGTGWNKNLNRVIKSLRDVTCHLRIIGDINSNQKKLLVEYGIEYSNSYNLTDEEIVEEYKKCDIVSFPSEYEGFGMPIIEGQKTGRIVVTSKIEPLIEVSNDAVCYVNPLDIDSLRKGFLKTINNKEFRKQKIALGTENVKRFEVGTIAEKYIDLYKNL